MLARSEKGKTKINTTNSQSERKNVKI